jgi:hypothetical protein
VCACVHVPTNSDDEREFRLWREIEAAGVASDALHADVVLLRNAVLLGVLLGSFEGGNADALARLLQCVQLLLTNGTQASGVLSS